MSFNRPNDASLGQPDDKQLQEARRKKEDADWRKAGGDFAAYYSATHPQGWPQWRRIDKPRDNDLPANAPEQGFGELGLKVRLFEDGLYRRAPDSNYDIRVVNGHAHPLLRPSHITINSNYPALGSDDWKEGYSATIDFLASAKGYSSISIDWSDHKHVSKKAINLLLDMIESKGLKAEFGPNVTHYLDILPQKEREKFYQRQDEINRKFEAKEKYRSLSKEITFENMTKELETQQKLAQQFANTQPQAGQTQEQALRQALRDSLKDAQNQPLQGQDRLTGIEKEMKALEERIKKMEAAYHTVSEQIRKSGEMVAAGNVDLNKDSPYVLSLANEEALEKKEELLAALTLEKTDLAERQLAWNEELAQLKTNLPPQQANRNPAQEAQFTKITELETKHGELNTRVNNMDVVNVKQVNDDLNDRVAEIRAERPMPGF